MTQYQATDIVVMAAISIVFLQFVKPFLDPARAVCDVVEVRRYRNRRRRRLGRARLPLCQDKCRETSKYHTQGRKVEKYKSRKCTLNKSYIKMNRKKMRKK